MFRARPVHRKPDPPDAGNKHLTSEIEKPVCYSGSQPDGWRLLSACTMFDPTATYEPDVMSVRTVVIGRNSRNPVVGNGSKP